MTVIFSQLFAHALRFGAKITWEKISEKRIAQFLPRFLKKGSGVYQGVYHPSPLKTGSTRSRKSNGHRWDGMAVSCYV
jgi:hypothetical protein